ncbi:MAG: hypothetical protein OXQ92_05705 [Boseongicola sp.]|nr:hypothetical protein [Boseongicola sp.]MDD9976423.1 hypothetical protein [Boseongicola sp.]
MSKELSTTGSASLTPVIPRNRVSTLYDRVEEARHRRMQTLSSRVVSSVQPVQKNAKTAALEARKGNVQFPDEKSSNEDDLLAFQKTASSTLQPVEIDPFNEAYKSQHSASSNMVARVAAAGVLCVSLGVVLFF